MSTVINYCTPKNDVLKGGIDDAIFAADIYAVYANRAPPIYQDPQMFFENTYPTEGLRELLSEVFGRLSGVRPDANPVLKLETSLGGGKTHALIALYHIARSGKVIDNISHFISLDILPREDVHMAVLAALEYGASGTGRTGSVSPKTLWGELAYQLGGSQGYAIVEEADKGWQAPGAAILDRVFDLCGEPVLILIDELAAYMAGMRPGGKGGRQVGDNLVNNVAVFLQQLLQVASRRKQVVVVLSLTGRGDIYGEETERLLSTIEKVASRVSSSISPARENEIVSVIKKRLFERIDEKGAKNAASSYLEFYRSQDRMGVPLPQYAVRTEFRDQLERSYPLHPELLSILDNKLSTIPSFNRTRGALRLLVRVIRHYWRNKELSAFIMPYNVSLDDEDIREELTGKLSRENFRPVIQNDIYSRNRSSKAQEVDGDKGLKVAQNTATVIFLNSLAEGQPGGIDKSTLYLATIGPDVVLDDMNEAKIIKRGIAKTVPGIKPQDVDEALEALLDKCWYLYDNGGKYVFKTEWNINKVIAEEVGNVGLLEAKDKIEALVRNRFKSPLFNVSFFPSGPSDVPDDDKLKLVVVHWDSATSVRGGPVPEIIAKIQDRSGQAESFRVYRNSLLFLVADGESKQNMIEKAKRKIALERIRNNKDLTSTLSKDQIKRLEEKEEKGNLDLLVSVLTAYRHLYFPPRAVSPEEGNGLRQLSLRVDESANIEKLNQQEKILEALESEDKVIRGDAKPIDPAYVFERAWNQGEVYLSTLELIRRFAKKPNLPIILNPETVKKVIREGAERDLWVYSKDGRVYGKGSTPIQIELDENAELFLPEEAKRRGITAPKEEEEEDKCPRCGKPLNECICSRSETVQIMKLEGEGDVERAFTHLLERARENKVKSIKEIQIGVNDFQGLRALGLLIPQLGKTRTSIDLYCDFGGEGKPYLSIAFKGLWDDYREVKDFIERVSKALLFTSMSAKFNLSFPEPLEASEDGVSGIKNPLKSFGANSVKLSAEPGE